MNTYQQTKRITLWLIYYLVLGHSLPTLATNTPPKAPVVITNEPSIKAMSNVKRDVVKNIQPNTAPSKVTVSQGAPPAEGGKSGVITLSVATDRSATEIYYTTNGKEPSTEQYKNQYTGPFDLTLSRTITVQAVKNGLWGPVTDLVVTPKALTPIVTTRLEQNGVVQWVSAHSASYYDDRKAKVRHFATIEYLDQSNTWQVLDRSLCQALADDHCGEIRLDAHFKTTKIRAQQYQRQSAYSDEVSVSYDASKKPPMFSAIEQATANAAKYLIFSTSWVEGSTSHSPVNRPRFGFAKLYGGKVEYYYQAFEPETFTDSRQTDSAYKIPYNKEMIEGIVAEQENIQYATAGSQFAVNMNQLYKHADILPEKASPTRFRQGHHEQTYCPMEARGNFRIPQPAVSKVLNGTYHFDKNNSLIINLGKETFTWRPVTIQDQFEASQHRTGIEYINATAQYGMAKQTPTVMLLGDDQSIALTDYKNDASSKSITEVKGYGFVSDDIINTPKPLNIDSHLLGQYYGFGMSNDNYAAKVCVAKNSNKEMCGANAITVIAAAKPAYSLTSASHDIIQIKHPKDPRLDLADPTHAKGTAIYGNIELCGSYGKYNTRTGHTWDQYLKHCVSYVLLNAKDKDINLNPSTETADITMPSTWIPYVNGHIYDNDYLDTSKKLTTLAARDTAYHGPYCYDKFETIGGHKKLMLGNWEERKITKFVFLEYSYDAKGYPIVVIGKVVDKQYIGAR